MKFKNILNKMAKKEDKNPKSEEETGIDEQKNSA